MVQRINIGNQSNDGTGDSIREAFKKVNDNFTELYGINNLGEGLYLTKLKDTPQKLIASSINTATILIVDSFGNTLTQRSLVAGDGISITNSGTQLILTNVSNNLEDDKYPALGGNLNGMFYKGYDFANPEDDQDLATKYYVDNNGAYSRVNLYVSLNGRDDFPPSVPSDRQGRNLGYAFRTVNKACQVAEDIIKYSPLELSTYQQFVQLNDGVTTATVHSTGMSPAITSATRVIVNLDVASGLAEFGSDQYRAQYIRPGQRIQGRDTETIAFINTLGLTSAYAYNKDLCQRDTVYILDAITADLVLGSTHRSVTAGLAYLRTYANVAYDTQNSETQAGINKARDLAIALLGGDTTATSIITSNVEIITDIIQNGLAGLPGSTTFGTTYSTSTNATYAADIIKANKGFLIDEVIAFIDQTLFPISIPNYDEALCRRDTGYLIDALVYDILYGGDTASCIFAEAYYNLGTLVLDTGEVSPSTGAFTRLSDVLQYVVTNNTSWELSEGNLSSQNTSYTPATSVEGDRLAACITKVNSIINGAASVRVDPSFTGGLSTYQSHRTAIMGATATIVTQVTDYIDTLGNFEYYDVTIISGPGFARGEPILFSQAVPKTNISIFIESGIYYEQLPIRVPANTSIRGDEFRRTIIKPAPLGSTSKWANIYFRRDEEFDGLTADNNKGQANLAINAANRFGWHYLTNPTDPSSTPKLNEDMDVFLLNDQTILRAISCHGHGGFMCVLDPEGQILTKSPYVQNCASFSRSQNEVVFSGGTYIDGFAGNLLAEPVGSGIYWTGTLTINVTGLDYRQPQTPTAFYYLGNRYEVDFITDYNEELGTANLHLNPNSYGGIAVTSGTITVNDGSGYSSAPTVLFGQPTTAGGYAAKGIANVTGGQVKTITITNPGSGYVDTDSVLVEFVGGNPLVAAASFSIPASSIKKGFIGVMPGSIELLTAGNKSQLNADYTQVNDLGYGIVSTNNGFQENVSIFTYYTQVGYYSNKGGQFRSLNGSNAYGNFALKAKGYDPNEIPIPVLLSKDMVQTATVVSYNFGAVNAVNTTTGASIYIRNYSYLPFNQCEVEVDHGSLTDTQGNVLGIQRYQVNSANTASGTYISDLAVLNLATAGALGVAAGGLKAPISSGTVITIRSLNVNQVIGVNQNTFLRTTSVVTWDDNTGTNYHLIDYETTGLSTGTAKVTSRDPFEYVSIQTYEGMTASTGTTTIAITNLDSVSAQRVMYYTASNFTAMTFGWKNGVYKITNYASSATTGHPYAQITISPALANTLTNVAHTSSVEVLAGLRAYSVGRITNRISVLRVTGHDLVDVGTGGFASTRIPNDLYGPPDKKPSSSYYRVEEDKGRVFSVTTDQDGNFTIGDVFNLNQNTGDLTIRASLSLTNVDGLGFRRGVVVREFSYDDSMQKEKNDSVPTELAIVTYLNRRLGISKVGTVNDSKIGSGFLDLTGIQPMLGDLEMNANQINMGGAKIINVNSCTNAQDAAPKIYADQKLSLAGISSIDPQSGSTNAKFGIMTGKLRLVSDPITSSDDQYTAATLRYVNKIRTFSTLSDVNLISPKDVDFVMFNASTVQVNTTTDNKPVWFTSTQITNVSNSTATIANTTATSAGGSDITVTRWNNTVTFKLVGGKGSANPITDYHISDNAAIRQPKLSMCRATVGTTSTGIDQSNLGLARFDDAYFVDGGNGWITLKTPLNVFASCACRVQYSLSPGVGFTSSSASFNGSVERVWSTTACCSNTANAIVCRDSSGNFNAGTISAALDGKANCACCLYYNAGSYSIGCTASYASTFAVRDSSCNITANCFVGTAVCAFYADLAENYHGDRCYEPCTVLAFGGKCEVTIADEATPRVAGVVSTNPAYHMNSGAVGEHLNAVALTGRVPTKVYGPVKKGDLMISAGKGFAKAIGDTNPPLGSIIGKSLEDFDGIQGTIEIVVGKI